MKKNQEVFFLDHLTCSVMRLKWNLVLLVTTMLCPACKHGDDVVLTEVYLYCEYYDFSKLTTKEQEAIVRYFQKVHWQPRRPNPPGTFVDRVPPDQPPITVECVRWFQNGTHWATGFDVNEKFQPDDDDELMGQETSEYKMMVQTLTEFRQHTPLRPSARFKEWEEMKAARAFP